MHGKLDLKLKTDPALTFNLEFWSCLPHTATSFSKEPDNTGSAPLRHLASTLDTQIPFKPACLHPVREL